MSSDIESLWLNRWMWGNNCAALCKVANNHRLQLNNSLEDLYDKMRNIDYQLKDVVISTVLGSGNIYKPEIMIIGEAPGREEDEEGMPFVGRSGKLLDHMLSAIDLNRDELYITNILPWRPPGNRTPTPEEVNIMLPYVLEHISIIQPMVILLLGSTAARGLLKIPANVSMVDAHGKWYELNGIPIIATYHPAYMLRLVQKKAAAWQVVIKIREYLDRRTKLSNCFK